MSKRLADAIEDGETVPAGDGPRHRARSISTRSRVYSEKIADLEKKLRRPRPAGETTARLQTMPGIGPITAMAIEAFAPPMDSFRRGRDFAAWLGLVPRQKSTGGKQILGKTSKMGQRDIRRLLIIGAMAVVRWAARSGALRRVLAGAHAGAQAAHGCGHRARQQDGTVRLGHAGEAGELPGPGGGTGLIGQTTSVRRGCEEVSEQ